MNTDFLKNNFKQTFQQEASDLFFSPGRINIIGEHTDYNGGHVFPCAISLGNLCRLWSQKRQEDRHLFQQHG